MEQWRDQGIILSARAHGENGAVITLLTENNGRHAGYVRGAHSSRNRGLIQPGNLVAAQWSSRVADGLGAYDLELALPLAAPVLGDGLRLQALLSACSLCEAAVPEREGQPALFHGLRVLLETLQGDVWGPAYVMWEIALLRELGFGMDISSCALGGDAETLSHISPKSGRAVSAARARPYLDKLIALPQFLQPAGGGGDEADVRQGLVMTGHFLEQWVFAHHSSGVPEPRLRFAEKYAANVTQNGMVA